jgi:two-component system, sensor histidine kinase
VVEDNEDVRLTMQDLLELRGHQVHLACDGPTGLEAALNLRPQVALVDLGLPGMDGFAVAQQIRARGAGDMLLVALTGYGGDEARVRTRLAGFDEHMVKPIAAEDLWDLLDRARRPELNGEEKTCRQPTPTTNSMPARSSRP